MGITIHEKKHKSFLPLGWKKAELGSVLDTLTAPLKIKTTGYLDQGKYPIVDQGKRTVIGYTNCEKAIVEELPAIIFGDHTKQVKFIDSPQ